MSRAKSLGDCKICIPARLNYLNVFKPDPYYEDKEKYTAVLIIDKSDEETISLINQTIREAHASATARAMKFQLTKDNQPLKEGPEQFPKNPAFANAYCITVKTTRKPTVLRKEKDGSYVQLGEGDIKDGDYALVIVSIRPYTTKGNSGITAYLDRILFVREGEPLGGLSNDDAFGDVDVQTGTAAAAAAADDDLF